MVTRRTRNFKEKNAASNILARLVMPVAVLMALALFYFSIKLFFFSPPRQEAPPLPSTHEVPTASESYDDGGDYGELPSDEMGGTSEVTPDHTEQTAEPEPEPARTVEQPKPAPPRPAPAPRPAQAQRPAAAQSQQPAQSAGPRWDVQIGGFRARSGAELTMRQAREKGYSAYVVDEVLDGKPFYKVRVRGHADRKEAQTLSKQLEAAGFPVYVVSIK